MANATDTNGECCMDGGLPGVTHMMRLARSADL